LRVHRLRADPGSLSEVGAGNLQRRLAGWGGEEGDFSCPSGTPLSYLVGLRYSDAAELEVEAEYHSCDTARTEDGYWGATTELEKEMNALLAGWVPYRHRSKPPFFTTP
jgi:hypothetical protein